MRPESGAAAVRPGRLSILLLLPVQAALMVGVGLLVTGPLADQWPLAAEDGVNRALAAHRGGLATPLSGWLSQLAGTRSIITLTLLVVVTLLAVSRGRRLREALFPAVAVAAQSAVFLLVTLVVQRPRPDVPHLDAAPPTSSFPSGHVGASVALFGGLAVLVAARLRGDRRWVRYVAVGVLLLVPVAVACSRVYRGMHHPSDVVGGLLNGACTLLVVTHALLLPGRRSGTAGAAGDDRLPSAPAPYETPYETPYEATPEAPPETPRNTAHRRAADDPVAPATGPAGARRVVVVRHPLGCGADQAERLRVVLDRHGYADQVWTSTSAEQPAGALAGRITGARTGLVVVCGGDGTVRACADVVAGTGIPLAIVPCGTGNLLARNLRLPADPATALEAALSGETVRIDVARVWGEALEPGRFTVMAGAGFDAAMVAGTSERAKERLGWVAYVLSAVRHLGDPRMRLSIRVDGGPQQERRARMVVIGNVGTLQGGLPLLPDARPDSGRLEVVLLDPRGARGWLAAAGHLGSHMLPGRATRTAGAAVRGAVAGGALEYFSAVRVDIRFARPQPRELDGDVVGAGTRLTAEVEPGALRIWLPPRPRPVEAPTATAEPASSTIGG
ncbi:diacylglycerol kinase family protein [Streptomyces sp. NPDC046557]|uniref:diacylglycerol kinase family protein n=1 Tax=Streptomyces sp. NPDC046557 TaxID=3155372 RepID=UPI0033D9E0BC